ncbi:glycosyl hydrolase 115 family protein [Caulobacter sp. NIBR2454]|uniref:glycosyl hydrolase 115 family protein n=1 Tax=Caulobacter sp. NIBR2454 TaxID=3015996 RepID=UPI0022B74C96|nr:glycosyl hydrolase 115 family protein [Caulobacter sp. NIBR2454]
MLRVLLLAGALACAAMSPTLARACTTPVSVCAQEIAGSFPLIRGGQAAGVYIDAVADPAVRHVADSFAADLQRVGGKAAPRLTDVALAKGDLVIIGVQGGSPVIDALVRDGKIKADDLAGQWEAYRQIVVERPFPNVPRALVIVGSDRRGAVFGAYDLSEKMGVSPWHWFADVPTERKANVFITAGERSDAPKVRYRGFFINDEDPAFGTWSKKKFGGANADMYRHVFELMLRLKGNYLWPAMWQPRAFNADDPRNMVLADEMGVVMGTSHHEPLTRAHDEWGRAKAGAWDYAKNGEQLRIFWRGGVERMMSKGNGQPYENLVTIGMRGDGDEAMSEDTAIGLMETIVSDQRKIIADVTGKPAEKTPQVWALYKEVQDYYDRGMKVPDDVILLFADDNWGQVRRLPTSDSDRAGGYGVYYHFDYVGAPRNYKWLNTVQNEKTWQQMDLAYAKGARALWIVNVGDIKPMEFPLSFFMKQAWNPEAMTPEALARYPQDWARDAFGPAQAARIGDILTRYGQLAARRKPELINAGSFPLGPDGDAMDGGEFGIMIDEWRALKADVAKAKAAITPAQSDAFFQLVEHPVAALSNLYELYYAVAWNQRLAPKSDPRADAFADQAEAAFARDQQIAGAYHALGGGKWDGMMLQTHIGYTNWQQPPANVMPKVQRVGGAAKPIVFAKPTPVSAPGVAAIEAPRFTRAVGGQGLEWTVIPHLGRTLGSVVALPQGRAPTTQADGVRLEYETSVAQAGDLTVELYLSPTLDVTGKTSLRLGVSIDDGPMQVLTDRLLPAPTDTRTQEQRDWNKAVEDNARVVRASFPGVAAGKHVVKVWRLDDNVVLQKLVIGTGGFPASYLGVAAR